MLHRSVFPFVLAVHAVLLPQVVSAQPSPGPDAVASALPAEMNSVYLAFRSLQPFMYRKDAFTDPDNEKKIGKLLATMSDEFHKIEVTHARRMREPGFASTIKVLNDLLDDARYRFDEGKKGYALWRLKASSNYCVACHTRFEVKVDFSDPSLAIEGMNSFERGELLLASRQFDRAKDEFLAAALDKNLASVRIDALRKWLIIYVRVTPDPRAALTELTKLRSSVHLSRFEDDEVASWIDSLRRWQEESPLKVDLLAKAENLIRQGLGMNDVLYGRKGTVELLRATSLLHDILDRRDPSQSSKRSRVLYLLGLAYSELPFFFINELPDLFLEQCIRDFPGSDDAKRSFALYKEIVSVQYTGSGGTRLPDDVLAEFKELHDLAYGVPQVGGRV